MKLLTKTTLFIITISLFVFFIGGFSFHRLFSSFINKRVNKELIQDMHNFLFVVKSKNVDIKTVAQLSYRKIEIEKCTTPPAQLSFVYNDTILHSEFNHLYMPHRTLTFYAQSKGRFYKVLLYKSMIETYLLIEHIALGMTLMVFVFIFCLFFLNRYFYGRIWADFFIILENIRNYDLNNPTSFHSQDSMIIEFSQLNNVLQKMTHQIRQDYLNLKEFTGNVSHEIQTPLAIVKAKIEMLLQTSPLNETQIKLISDISNTNNRLSKLNTALILLTKIENHQFKKSEKIEINKILQMHIENFEGMLDAKQITLEHKQNEKLTVEMNDELISVLLINLLKNAIRHNYEHGKITISTTENTFEIANTGKQTALDTDTIFNRFVKDSDKKESIGLGLAIVKKICEYYKFRIDYNTKSDWHVFKIHFK